ncbi:hypothetical protein ABE244_25620 [Bacillus toyonensis]|uniref:hypothetical protein n=1 Tax=Bacillus toyonensis TaxID=155322 RepID=UPI003D23F924
MDKGLTFLTLSLVFLWLVFDDFVGKKRLSNLATMMTPDLSVPIPFEKELKEAQQKGIEKSKEQVSELEKQKKDDKKKKEEVKKKGIGALFDFSWSNSHIYNHDFNQIGPGRVTP